MKNLLIITTISATLRAFFIPLARHFQSQGWQVDAMAKEVTASPECLETFNQVWEVEWSRNPLEPKNLLVAPQQIRKAFAQKAYDLVLVSTPVAAFVTRYALSGLRKQGKPKVIYTAQGFHFYRGGAALKNAIFLTLEKLAGRWTDYLVVVNREDEEAAKRYGLVPAEQVRYIPGTGLNCDRFNPQAISVSEVLGVRQELDLSPETPLFLCVAEFIPRKHHRDLLTAFARLGRPQVQLALAGEGPLLQEMQQMATNLGIQSQVRFLGRRQDVDVLMSASIATVLVSDQEGLPNCVMESLCLGVPVIGTDIRGTRDLLQDDCGILVKVGNIEALTQAMAWVLDHPEKAQLMAKRGQQRVASYALQSILQQYEALYAEATLPTRLEEVTLPV